MWTETCVLYLASAIWCSLGAHCPVLPMPCCAIYQLPERSIPSIFSVSSIHLVDPGHCQGICVAKLRSRNGSVTTETCVNGFAIRSFLGALLRRIGSRATPDELRLLHHLSVSLSTYSATLNASTANSSVLGVLAEKQTRARTRIFVHGRVAKRKRVGAPKRRKPKL
ncbi:ORF47 [Retroperitoneal fibromatosis-associated herpesvirus]|uniref:ORF47 n=1 Tax=Retroperitoneal fibromatosis-associated herpesvirus TaxID=111469 RepID=U5NM64_9GAMA|nr:ORF47 [Retroperitoneal fibromatosis-associated herpesvirus]AGY30728.1 ORF47 [Retroperitoneal fibromatosis-associated herpesvirus]